MRRALIAVLISFLAIPARAESQITIAELVARVRPAVVTIITYDASFRERSQGSGFFVDAEGSLVSSRHVFEGAHFAEVVTVNGARLPVANVIGEDEVADLIKVRVRLLGDSVAFVSLSPGVPPLGESVVVVGSPLGLDATVSNGIVSGLRQVPLMGSLIQITAPISRGSSGSPVVDSNGEVIGVAALQLIEGQNLNFAVPASRILDMPAPTAAFSLREWSSPRPVQSVQPTAESPRLPRAQPELRGARIRMHASAIELRGLTGTVTALGPDTLLIRPDGTSGLIPVPFVAVDSIQIQQGITHKGLLGLVFGGLAGAVAGYVVADSWCGRNPGYCYRGETLALGVGVGVGGGGLVGYLIGRAFQREKWQSVAPVLIRPPR